MRFVVSIQNDRSVTDVPGSTRMFALFSVAEIGERTFETFREKDREKILQQLLHQACGEKLPSRAFQLYDGFCGNKLLLHVHER